MCGAQTSFGPDPRGEPLAQQRLPTVLVIDDEQPNVDSLRKIFEREKLEVLTGSGGKEALAILPEQRVDVLVCDVMMPKIDGMDVLKATRQVSPETEVVLMTAYGTVELAVEAMKLGAYDFITKPVKRRDIVKAVRKALERSNLLRENRRLRDRLKDLEGRPAIVGQSPALRRTMDVVGQAAPAIATVLILGESGTGKELIAREIHRLSPRNDGPFVPVNCAAIPETLLESELFGFEKGAFTSANAAKPGRFELADGGTLFLDEIGELPVPVQVKLLRVLQDSTFERLGSTHSTTVDLRIVAATNKDLEAEVRSGRFREDLYYRLNVIEVRVPPLRERSEDIPLLVYHFLEVYARKNQRPVLKVPGETMTALQNYGWPGNVRELENVIERAVVLAPGEVLAADDLPGQVAGSPPSGQYLQIPFGTPLDEIERRVTVETLRRTNGDKKLAAQILGIATRTIYRKLESMAPEGRE